MLSEWIAFDADATTGIERLRARFTRHAYDRHAHETYAIGMTEVGSQTFTCRGESHATRPGAIILFNPTELHDGHATTADGFTYRMLYIDTATVRGVLAGEAGNPEPLFDQPLALDPTTARLIARAYDVLAPETPTMARDDVSLRDLADLAGLSRFHLTRLFPRRFGLAPSAYLRLLRLERAKRRLAAGDALADVAAALGFVDQAHLTRRFKAAYGMTPGRYRASRLRC